MLRLRLSSGYVPGHTQWPPRRCDCVDKAEIVDIVISDEAGVIDDVLPALNPCDYNNGGCEQQCTKTDAVSGQIGYRCSCQSGVLAPDNHTCVSSSECCVISFSET